MIVLTTHYDASKHLFPDEALQEQSTDDLQALLANEIPPGRRVL